MGNNVEHSPFFQQQAALGRVIVKDPPKFDLETYIANYEGRTRVDRLELIGSTSIYLSVDAFKLAIAEAKKGKDVERYLMLVENLHQVLPADPSGIPDLGWADSRIKQVKGETDRLEQELKGYKNNLIKESIRMGNEDLGAFYYSTGDLGNAQRSYSRMRDFCTLAKHIAEMGVKLILVAVAQRNWMVLHSQVQKITQLTLKPEDTSRLEPALEACSGLALMSSRQYREAAGSFLKVTPAFITLEPVGGVTFQKEILTGNDVAVYGGLCALASMDRTDLQNLVLAKADFRQFLELEPHIRRAISLFCSSKYAACLEILEAYRTDWLLDIYLQPLVAELFQLVRTKCIIEYFKPFSSVSLDEMAKAFEIGATRPILDELLDLIKKRQLNARIDLIDNTIVSVPRNPRRELYEFILECSREYEKQLHFKLWSINMKLAGAELKAPRNPARSGLGSMPIGDDDGTVPVESGSLEGHPSDRAGGGMDGLGGEPMKWS